ncbi:DNA-3-methyladenine glycosylase I [Pasteurella bettyae]|uniref:DNA-3-methyladenine glycosylase I n=1 Tax=Pasteurella bettyae CCUG 2042 TaxID=1095749 RepID=I3DBG6_9PAST|nr:DNA-3-methyladenine glycosylase I [Pasteurella bettyae]EIJ69059.1 DNA-3-methyladenine glycosylase I [Pasteurella bettyae CCUG 2042]SUB22792.1 DNA-3-methyladenine glycosylase [Pasteurella bettyae]
MIVRCSWANGIDIYEKYHDEEWGKPEFDSIKLFEKICLEGQQAGLAWITILKKRENYRKAFYQFNPELIVNMTDQDIDKLMLDKGLIRHRIKLEAIVKNAKAYMAMQKCGENFSNFIWSFVNNQPQINDVPTLNSIPTKTETSKLLSKALKKRGFVFVGEITCYAFMQSMGLVNDHINDCFCKNK